LEHNAKRNARVPGMEGCTIWDTLKYLGVPIFKSNPRTLHWNLLIDKLKNKINSWGASWLNIAGKVVIIKAIPANISIYQSSLLLAPSTIIQKIEAMLRIFLWEGGKQSGRKLHLISWEKISKPISEGGLNFKNIHAQKMAFRAKILGT